VITRERARRVPTPKSETPTDASLFALTQDLHRKPNPSGEESAAVDLILSEVRLTVFLNGNGGIDHVVNDTGASVDATNQVTNIVSYP
jgi:hypothetical protein